MHETTFFGTTAVFKVEAVGEFAHDIETAGANGADEILKMRIHFLTGTGQEATHGASHIPIHEFGEEEESEGVETGDLRSDVVVDDGSRRGGAFGAAARQTDGFVDFDEGFQQALDDLGIIF